MHLTNFSVNRHSKAFVKATDGAQGSKWSFKALLAYLAHQTPPVDVEKLVERINDIAVRSIIAVEPVVAGKMEAYRCPRTACFEVLGFDILLDQELNPWLLEINSMPSLSSSSSLDKFIKTKLIADVFHTIGMVPAENDLKVIRRVQTRRLPPAQIEPPAALVDSDVVRFLQIEACDRPEKERVRVGVGIGSCRAPSGHADLVADVVQSGPSHTSRGAGRGLSMSRGQWAGSSDGLHM